MFALSSGRDELFLRFSLAAALLAAVVASVPHAPSAARAAWRARAACARWALSVAVLAASLIAAYGLLHCAPAPLDAWGARVAHAIDQWLWYF